MKKQMCLAALCLLAVAGGCAKIPETEPGGNTRENAATAAMPVDGENHLYTLSAETPQGLYNIKGGGGQYFLDYAAAENRPLCTVPGCTHTGEDCAACLPEGTYGMFCIRWRTVPWYTVCRTIAPILSGAWTAMGATGRNWPAWRVKM